MSKKDDSLPIQRATFGGLLTGDGRLETRLYSYLLFYGPPTPDSEERYLAALDAYAEEIPDVREFLAHAPKSELNITYLPPAPWGLEGAETSTRLPRIWLEQYDFARAKLLLRVVPPGQRDGPYIISYDKPLSRIERELGRNELLFQDLSWVPPNLIRVWVRAFLRQAGQPGAFNREDPWQQFILKLRSGIEVAATGLPEVEKAWADGKEPWEKAVTPVKLPRQP